MLLSEGGLHGLHVDGLLGWFATVLVPAFGTEADRSFLSVVAVMAPLIGPGIIGWLLVRVTSLLVKQPSGSGSLLLRGGFCGVTGRVSARRGGTW